MRLGQDGPHYGGEYSYHDHAREQWPRAAALGVLILALLAAVAGFKALGWALAGQTLAAQEARLWGEAQERAAREEVLRLSRDFLTVEKLLEPKGGRIQKFVADRHKEVEAELARLDQERQKLRADAEAARQAGGRAARHQQAFWRAALLLTAALVLAAAAGLFQKKLLWLAGLAGGAVGLAFFVNAFFLWV